MRKRRREGKPASIEAQLRLGSGFGVDERAGVIRRLRRLDRRLKTFADSDVDLALSVKERDTPSQRVVLECGIAGRPHVFATSTQPELGRALTEVREDLARQVNDAKTKREPRNNRKLRRRLTTPHRPKTARAIRK